MEKVSRTFQALLPRSLRMRLLMFLLAAIVQAIAQGHGATVALDSSARLGGLRVTVRFAAARP